MDDSAEEDPGESLEEENLAASPTAGHTDNHEDDNQKNQDQGEAYDQTDYRIGDQNAQRLSGEPEPIMFDQANHKDSEHLENSPYDQADRKSSEQTDDKTYNQIENVADVQTDRQVPGLTDQGTSEQTEESWSRQAQRKASEQADHRMSTQSERQGSIQTDRRMSSQTEKRTSGQTDDRLSIPSDPTVSGQTDSRTSDQAERKTSEKIDKRLSRSSDPGTSEENVDRQAERIYEKVFHGSYEKSLYNTDDQVTEGAEQQTFDQADQLKVNEDDFSQPDQTAYLVDKEAYPTDDPSSFVSEYGLFPQFGDGKEAQNRVQPCTFEDSETHLKSTLSVEMETESISPMQSQYPTDTGFTGQFLEKDQTFYQRLPSISTKSDVLSQEKNQATGISLDDYSQSEQAKSSRMINQVIYKRRPPIVYEDPYEVSLQYMEKHHILQIFQITENLVYEKPEDPLSFMLCQVQEMMKNRDKT